MPLRQPRSAACTGIVLEAEPGRADDPSRRPCPEPEDHLDHPQSDHDRGQLAAGRRGGPDPRQVVDGDLDEPGARGDRDQHHLRAGVVPADRHPVGHQTRHRLREQLVGAADVAEVAGVEEDLDALRDAPVPPLQEPLHVRAVPDQLAGRPGPEDGVAVLAEDEQLLDVGGQEGPVGLGEDDQVAARLAEAAAAGVSVALLGLEDLAGRGLRDLLARPRLGVVVDDDDLIDDSGREEALDDRADRIPLRIGHQHHRNALLSPHPGSEPTCVSRPPDAAEPGARARTTASLRSAAQATVGQQMFSGTSVIRW